MTTFKTLAASTPFFVTGGTLSTSATSYIVRQADRELYENLLAGEFCYVLNSRQMGKSSLMVRTAERLKQAGQAVAVLDLQAIGQNLSPEQWFEGLLLSLGKQIRREDELEDFWDGHSHYGPLQRFFEAIRAVALPACPNGLVLFVDEIDIIRTLPFSADEFFMGIRQCYVGRTTDAEWKGLTFCLLGTATPADLISDTRTSPFNIGKRVEVRDFTPEEAAPLATGFGCRVSGVGVRDASSQLLLDRVLYWTAGHPYLTQRLCRAVADALSASIPNTQHPIPDAHLPVAIENRKSKIENPTPDTRHPTPALVDRLCTELFLTHRAKETDDNLMFVRNRLLKSEADLAALLDLYGQMRRGKRVAYDETNPLCPLIRLSGVAKVREGVLLVRNRIYLHVFDGAWVISHMPDAELRRQRAAYRKGWMRSVAISSVIIVAMGALVFRADSERNKAQQAEYSQVQVAAIETELRTRTEALLYASDMNVAQQAWEWGDLGQARKLIERNLPGQYQKEDYRSGGNHIGSKRDRRGFEWRYLWRLGQGEELTTLVPGHTRDVRTVAFSPDRKTLATGSEDNTIKLWDMASRKEIATLPAGDPVMSMAFSPDGKILVSGSTHGTIKVWDVAKQKEKATLSDHGEGVFSVAFSPDGNLLASGHNSGIVKLWNATLWHEIAALSGHKQRVNSVAFSADGTTLASGSEDATIKLWNVASHQAATLEAGQGVLSVAFSPQGKVLAAGGIDGTVELWNVAEKRERLSFQGHKSLVNCVAFSPNGQTLASGSGDNTVKLWSVETGKELATLRGHTGAVYAVAFSPNGKTLASGSGRDSEKEPNYSVKLWSVTPKPDTTALLGHKDRVWTVAFSPDGKVLASGSQDNTIRLWNLASRKEIASLPAGDPVISMAFSPDGKTLVTGCSHGTVKVWDVVLRKEIASLPSEDPVISVAFSPDGKVFAAGYGNGMVWFWDAATRQEQFHFRAHDGALYAMAFYPDRMPLVTSNADGVAVGVITALFALTPYSKTLATSGADGTVILWKLSSGSPSPRKPLPIPSPHGVAFSPDGKTFAASSADGFVKLWNLTSGSPSTPHILHVPSPHGVAFSPDGKTLAIGSFDKTIRLWNLATHKEWDQVTPQEMLILKGHLAPVLNLAFSPDGDLLASAGWESPVRLWQAYPAGRAGYRGDEPPMRLWQASSSLKTDAKK